jgi:transposase InsO family protein
MRKVGALWPNPRPAPFSRERDVFDTWVWIGGREGYVYWVICGASKTKEPGRSHHTTINARTTANAMMSALFVAIASPLIAP